MSVSCSGDIETDPGPPRQNRNRRKYKKKIKIEEEIENKNSPFATGILIVSLLTAMPNMFIRNLY